MQNDKFKFQTVANTRQMVPAKKSKKKFPNLLKKKSLKLFHTPLKVVIFRRKSATIYICQRLQVVFFPFLFLWCRHRRVDPEIDPLRGNVAWAFFFQSLGMAASVGGCANMWSILMLDDQYGIMWVKQ